MLNSPIHLRRSSWGGDTRIEAVNTRDGMRGAAIVTVAVVETKEDGAITEWAAYEGVMPEMTEADGYKDIAANGDKIAMPIAKYLFPNIAGYYRE